MKKKILQLKKETIATLKHEEIASIYGGQEDGQGEGYRTEGKCFTKEPICIGTNGCAPTTTGHSPCINNC